MRLDRIGGGSVELVLVGYQFPDGPVSAGRIADSTPRPDGKLPIVYTEDDDNWLVVLGSVESERGAWTFREPCLQTWEVKTLARWLEDVSQLSQPEPISFTEPLLVFALAKTGQSDEVAKLIISFAHESRPPWSPPEAFETTPIYFDVRRQDLHRASVGLLEELSRFPIR